jgi:hypothetical protein
VAPGVKSVAGGASPRVSRPTVRRLLSLLLLSCFVNCDSALAQTNERLYEELDFRFVTPGARPVGMGKTFIGLADDATAAASNPAGLSNLLEKEFSFEFTGTSIRHYRLVPSEGGDVEPFGDVVLTPSFLSFVWPLGRATVSMFRHAVQDYRETYQFSGRFIESVNDFEDGSFGTLAVQAENYGLSGAFVVTRFLSVGGTLNLTTLDLASESRSGDPLSPRNGTNTIDTDRTLSGVLGVLAKPHKALTVGATYNDGAAFDLETTLFGTFLVTLPTGTRTGVVRSGERFPIRYTIPDRYAVGVSWRPAQALTLAMDLSRTRYSQLVSEKFLIVDFQDPAAGLTQGSQLPDASLQEQLDALQCADPCPFSIRDVSELHAGGEYRFYRERFTAALRAGVFTDPDRPLRFRPGSNPDHPADRLLDYRFNTVTSRTDVGATFGGGVTLRNRVQLDAAASFSRDATDVVVSVVVRMGH